METKQLLQKNLNKKGKIRPNRYVNKLPFFLVLIILTGKIRPFGFVNSIPGVYIGIYCMVKSDRFGMETSIILEVAPWISIGKIRPFRYGNFIYLSFPNSCNKR